MQKKIIKNYQIMDKFVGIIKNKSNKKVKSAFNKEIKKNKKEV
jgi:hypothetical protein